MRGKKDFRFDVGCSGTQRNVNIAIFLLTLVLVAAGPFHWQAKVIFLILSIPLGGYYRRRLNRCNSFAQLRYTNGVLLLVFNNGEEPELIQLVRQQRILPWLVEVSFKRESGEVVVWGIARDAMDRNSFRELKVFLQTHHQML